MGSEVGECMLKYCQILYIQAQILCAILQMIPNTKFISFLGYSRFIILFVMTCINHRNRSTVYTRWMFIQFMQMYGVQV